MPKPAKRKNKPGAGRPPKSVDWEIVKNLCVQHHTMGEIAAICGIDMNTLKARCLADNSINFSEFYKTNLRVGKSSIRKKLWEEAMNGNTQVLMHQAKHVLAQWDKQQIEVNVKPYVIESIDGKEILKLGAEHVDPLDDTIDIEAIEQSEQNYYDAETIDEDDNEPAKTE